MPMHPRLVDYPLPPELIAQFPSAERTASRLLTICAQGGGGESGDALREIQFAQLGKMLTPGDVLVVNNTRVLPARLNARKPSGGGVEIMLERILDSRHALVQLRSNKPIRISQTLQVDAAKLTVTDRRNGFFILECSDHDEMPTLFQSHGKVPLPPYIRRPAAAADLQRYQTVYARVQGAVAAPTAGLHFDQPLINALQQAGIEWLPITLHVGAGTFQPLRAETAEAHRMHREWIEVDRHACARITHAKSRGNRIIAVGTTVVRALETAARNGPLKPHHGDTDLFIVPGYRFRVVDALITNFHLPRSTLLMLVCAFAGTEKIMRAYQHAIAHKFRFYSYGDAMFVERAPAANASPDSR